MSNPWFDKDIQCNERDYKKNLTFKILIFVFFLLLILTTFPMFEKL